MTSNTTTRPGYLGGLDGLRALGALAVFGVHLDQIAGFQARVGPLDFGRLLPNGNHAVALFFTLSGFLLSLPFWRGNLTLGPKPHIGVYALRRAARILPAYYVSLTALIILAGLWRLPGARADILLHYSFLFNYAEFTFFSINSPYWTLAVEMQFYLLLPCLFLVFRRARLVWSLAAVAVVAGASYGLHGVVMRSVTRIVAWPHDPILTWIRPYGAVVSHSLLAHLPHFLLGVIGARLFLAIDRSGMRERKETKTIAEVLFWLCLIAMPLLLGTELNDRIQVAYGRYGLPLVPILLAAIVLTAPLTRGARKVLESAPLKPLGVISYGIYLYHVPCLNGIERALRTHGVDAADCRPLLAVAGFLLTVLAATASHLLVERPIIRLAHRAR